jgi:uncharacterized membrane protein (UPF0182 family)
MHDERIAELLTEIRDNQRESLQLQREAVSRAGTATVIAVVGILVCIAAIAYLILRYF